MQTMEGYRRAVPITTYEDLRPLPELVMTGQSRLLLSEDPIGWAFDRGTVQSESRFIPMTPVGPRICVSVNRGMIGHVANGGIHERLRGGELDLNFPRSWAA
jgi:hypothetical protein